MIFHSKLRILICLTCQLAFPPSHMVTHQCDQHQVIIQPSTWTSIEEEIHPYEADTDVTLPSQPHAPIEGIKLEDQALECQECQYICLTDGTMRTHWSNNHHGLLNQYPIVNSRFKTVEAQKLFASSSGHRQYFKVDSRLIGIPPEDTFSLFMQKYVKKESLLPTVAPPSNDRDLSLLVKLRGWYNHLQEFCNDSSKRALLIAMASLPTMGKEKAKALPPGIEKALSKLPEVITSYMEKIRKEQAATSRITLRSLMLHPP
jgi:Orsellinic acid/F9775 biosynthesis cluster protein D